MPPIYRFDLNGYPKESEWGWHRAIELVDAINNILSLSGRVPMTPEEIGERFPFIRLNPDPLKGYHNRPSSVVSTERPYGCYFIGETNWLRTLVKGDLYLPAKIGMQLIDAVKSPVRSALRRTFTP